MMNGVVHVKELTFGAEENAKHLGDLIVESDMVVSQLAEITRELDLRNGCSHTWGAGSSEFREVLKCPRFAAFNSRRLAELSREFSPEKCELAPLALSVKKVSSEPPKPEPDVSTNRQEDVTQVYDVTADHLQNSRLEHYLGIDLDAYLKDSKTLDGSAGTGSRGKGRGSPGSPRSYHRLHPYSTRKDPTFYVGGGNGVAQVEKPLLDIGWVRIMDKHEENFRLKWVECESSINYNIFKEGQQLVNHIPNCYLLTNKLGLLNSLQGYDRVCMGIRGKEPKLRFSDFIPETYRLEDTREREKFFDRFKPGELWICKPDGLNQGRGIYIVREPLELRKQLEISDVTNNRKRPHKPHFNRLIQRYLHDPLLLNGKKFDIRTYMLLASTSPYLLLYHNGYARLSMYDYDSNSENLVSHLTNQFIQKRDPAYKDVKEETAWSMDRLNDYINDHVMWEKGLEEDWVYNVLVPKMKSIILHCFNSVKYKLECKLGYFDIYGLDFMVDNDMKIWLIEINSNPCLATNCEALKEVIPEMIRETLYLVIECWEKAKNNQPLLPLRALRKFQVLYCASSPRTNKTPHAHRPKPSRSSSSSSSSPVSSTSPTQTVTPSGGNIQYRAKSSSPSRLRSRSLSPVKETQKAPFAYLRRQSVRSVISDKSQPSPPPPENKSTPVEVASTSDVTLTPILPTAGEETAKESADLPNRETDTGKCSPSGEGKNKVRDESAIPPKCGKSPRSISYKSPYEVSKSPVVNEANHGFGSLNQLNVCNSGTKSTPSLTETPRFRPSGQSEVDVGQRSVGKVELAIEQQQTYRPVRHSSANASARGHHHSSYPLRTSPRASSGLRASLPIVDQSLTQSFVSESVKLKMSHISSNQPSPRDPKHSNTTITYLGTFQGQPEPKVQGHLLSQTPTVSYLLAQTKLGQGSIKSGQTTFPDVRDSSVGSEQSVPAPAASGVCVARPPPPPPPPPQKPGTSKLPRRPSNRDNVITASLEDTPSDSTSRGN